MISLKRKLSILALLCFIPSISMAQTPPLVSTEPLQKLTRTLRGFETELSGVKGLYCPDLDTSHAGRVKESLRHAADILERYRWELTRGRAIARRHFEQVGSALVTQEGKLAHMQDVYAVQDFATNVGKLMLDMVDVTSFGNDLLKAILEKENVLAADKRMAQLRKAVVSLNDAAQAVEGVIGQAPPAIRGKLDPPEKPTTLNTVRQATQNFIGVANSASQYLEAQKKLAQGSITADKLAELKRGLKADVAQLALGLLQSHAESLRAEMSERIRELENIVPREEAVLNAAFRELQRWSSAQDAIEQAVANLRRTQRVFDSIISGYLFIPTGGRSEIQPSFPTAGESLRNLEKLLPGKVEAVVSSVQGFRVEPPITPRLTLPKKEYSPGEAIEVTFAALGCLSGRAWVGLIPAAIPHGSAKTNDEHDRAYRRMGQERAGKLSFTAPATVGSYDLRMNSDSDGVELTSLAFTVSRGREGIALPVPEGVSLQAVMGNVKSEKITIR